MSQLPKAKEHWSIGKSMSHTSTDDQQTGTYPIVCCLYISLVAHRPHSSGTIDVSVVPLTDQYPRMAWVSGSLHGFHAPTLTIGVMAMIFCKALMMLSCFRFGCWWRLQPGDGNDYGGKLGFLLFLCEKSLIPKGLKYEFLSLC